MRGWLSFIQERFPPLKHIPLILCFFGANAFIALCSFPLALEMRWKWILSFFVVLLIFFRLRIFDEIKDYKTDLLIHKERPLARGLISLSNAKRMAFSLILIELILSLIVGAPAFLGACLVSFYSLLMYKEFFIGFWLSTKLATYAITHTIISSLLSLFIFSAVTGLNIWEAPFSFLLFSLANWMLFNVFEFGRKTFGRGEEKEEVDSYSKNFGAWGACLSVLGMAFFAEIVAWILIIKLFHLPFLLMVLLLVLAVPLVITALLYGYTNSSEKGQPKKMTREIDYQRAGREALWFRGACSLFILMYNFIITLGFFL